MTQATSPTITLTLPDDIDLSAATQIYVTFKQDEINLTKDMESGVTLTENNKLSVFLSQEETLMFTSNDYVKVQVNWLAAGGIRTATRIKDIPVAPNLIPKVII